MTHVAKLFSFCAVTLAAVAPVDAQSHAKRPVPANGDRYEATIRRTSYGIPHITASDLASLGFGEGYAQAEDHLCTIADQVIRGRGERAKYFGRGENDRHVLSDIVARALRVRGGDSAHTPAPEIRGWIDGFVAGYNLYLERTGRDSVPGWCRGQSWVFPVTASDVRAAAAPVGPAAAMARAQPPTPGGPAKPDTTADDGLDLPRGASQGWALGRELSAGGRGMLLANPHYPWGGSNRFWEKHLTIPGVLDVYGVSLIGGVGVGIGFNNAVAWTHTTATAEAFTVYKLDLVPGKPTRYRYGSEERDMTPVEVAVEVRGEAEPVRRTIWFSHYGPIIVTPALGLTWTATAAYSQRFASGEGGLSQLLAMNRATSLSDFQNAYAEHRSLAAFNTVAVSAQGVAWYTTSWATPVLGEQTLAAWLERQKSDPHTAALWQFGGQVLLDGSNPSFEWRSVNDLRTDAAARRTVPQLERTDYVFNANNSFWVAHARERLEGAYSPLYGAQRSPLSLRARNNILQLTNAAPYLAAGRDGKFTLQEVQAAVLSNHSLAADLLVPEFIELCKATPNATVDGQNVDLSHACGVLERWDRRFDLDSRGAALFREWLAQYDERVFAGSNAPAAPGTVGKLFAVEFDAADPIGTPRGLAPGSLALENLAKAVGVLDRRSVPLDVPLGELQYAPTKLPRRIAVHGGNGNREGVLNFQEGIRNLITTLEPLQVAPRVTGSRVLTEAGYPVLHGSSFLLSVEYTENGPRAEAVLTYSQSGDPKSPHFIDQTELFARKQWRPVLFRADAIAADVKRQYTVSAARLR